ncbi:MAG: hypothetical protein H3C39_11250 [Flavobacteriia bacterium]|nr:hypothetical protein [Flavobacteriia bacterium]
MRTLTISISEFDFKELGLKTENLSFDELLEIINREIQRSNLRKSIELAEKYGLSELSDDEITQEVKAVRDAKNHY